jgi:hypothetical protein
MQRLAANNMPPMAGLVIDAQYQRTYAVYHRRTGQLLKHCPNRLSAKCCGVCWCWNQQANAMLCALSPVRAPSRPSDGVKDLFICKVYGRAFLVWRIPR